VNRFLIFVAALVVTVGVAWWAGSRVVTPPKKVGTAVEPPPSFPDRDENETARRLLALLPRADEEKIREGRSAAIDYIRREVSNPALEPAEPPNDVAKNLEANGKTIASMRALLLSNPPPVWKQRANDLIDAPRIEFPLFMQVFTLLSADALAEQSRGNTAAAWADLGAMNVLTQSLWTRPESNAVLLALTGDRLLNAAASKLPPPAPAWWSEFATFDSRPNFVRAMQYEAWAMRAHAERYPAGDPDDEGDFDEVLRQAAEPMFQPIRMFEAEHRAKAIRELAPIVATAKPCDAIPNPEGARYWASSARRLHRFVIEREGVTRLHAARANTAVDATSACKGTRWEFKKTDKGFDLAFTGKLPEPETRVNVPMRFTVPPAPRSEDDGVTQRR
jgi:hypothetical protein